LYFSHYVLLVPKISSTDVTLSPLDSLCHAQFSRADSSLKHPVMPHTGDMYGPCTWLDES